MLLSDPDAFKTVNFKTPPSTTALPPSCRPSGELEKLACTPMVDAKGVRFAIGGVVHRISVVVTWVAARMVESPYLQLNWEKSWKPCPRMNRVVPPLIGVLRGYTVAMAGRSKNV